MNISVRDGSSYFKGLLLLLRKDRKVVPEEVELMRRVGTSLGFERDFTEGSIQSILENEHIDDSPPHFSTPELAGLFLKDGLRIAHADKEAHADEIEWLRMTAERNQLDPTLVTEGIDRLAAQETASMELEVDRLKVQF